MREINGYLGLVLRSYRKRKGLSQKEMACILDVTREYYWRLENGRAYPSLNLVSKLLRRLDLSPGLLMLFDESRGTWTEDLQAISVLLSLPRDDLRIIRTLLDRLAQ